jgi:hypothetical protein
MPQRNIFCESERRIYLMSQEFQSGNQGFGEGGQENQAGASGVGYGSGGSVNQMPFIPMKQTDGPMKQSQAKAIIILMICILAINVAMFVTQYIMSPRVMNFSGGAPEFRTGGGVPNPQGGGATQGSENGATQAPPDFGQEEG